MKFKVGDKVKVISNNFTSVNKIGDIGIIEKIDRTTDPKFYKVFVENRKKYSNWHAGLELEPVSEYPKEMLVWDSNSVDPVIKKVIAYVSGIEFPYLTEDSVDANWKYIGYKHAKDLPQTKEVTMQEIADKFGVNVEQLKIKK